MARYRVLHLTSTSALGGAERMALELTRACDQRRFEMAIASIDGPGLLTQACLEAGHPAWNLRLGRPWPWRLWRLVAWIIQFRREKFDLVQTYGLQADLVARLCKPLLDRPRVVCGIRGANPTRPALHAWLDRLTAPAVDLFIANSESGRRARLQRERIDPERIRVIPNGIELDPPGLASRGEARRALGLEPDDAPVIAHVANIRPMKGHEEVLRSIPAILTAFPRAVFVFAGRDDSGGRIPRLARESGFDGNTRFLGFYPRPREVLRACDIAILPSHHEGCPVALLEAMADGRPIGASNAGGIPELVRHETEALLFPPADPGALARAVICLASNPELGARLGAAARNRAETEFGISTMVERYQAAYESLIRNGA